MSKQVEPKTNTTQSEETKPRYQPPKIILLNAITQGQGLCGNGSGDAGNYLNGTNGQGINCQDGMGDANLCLNGSDASTCAMGNAGA